MFEFRSTSELDALLLVVLAGAVVAKLCREVRTTNWRKTPIARAWRRWRHHKAGS